MIPIEATSAEELAKAVAASVKHNKWHAFIGTLNGKAVRVKVYGLYLQIFDVDGVHHGGGHFTTQKQLKDTIIGAI